MYPFLILSSLSVGFNLFLLVGLHRETRRHRRTVGLTGSKNSRDAGTIHLMQTASGATSRRNKDLFHA